MYQCVCVCRGLPLLLGSGRHLNQEQERGSRERNPQQANLVVVVPPGHVMNPSGIMIPGMIPGFCKDSYS